MANFNTHLLGASIASGVLSSTLLVTGLFTPYEGMLLWSAGTLGGLLPDLDADNSPTLSGLFNCLGILTAFLCLFWFSHLSLFIVWGIMLGVFVFIRFGLMTVFANLTVHRGAFHSLLATATFGLGTTYLCANWLHFSRDLSWAMGLMLASGYLVHLILDECYAVDLSNLSIKRSFGSALKPFSIANAWASAVFLAFTLYFAWAVPKPKSLDDALQHVFSQPFKLIQQPISRNMRHTPQST